MTIGQKFPAGLRVTATVEGVVVRCDRGSIDVRHESGSIVRLETDLFDFAEVDQGTLFEVTP